MPKKIVNDIIAPEKKSIRQIPLSSTKKIEPVRIPHNRGNRQQLNPKFVIWLAAIIALLALFFGVSLIFSSATVSVTPRIESISFNNDTYTAKLDSLNPTELPFEVLKINKTSSLSVKATEEKATSQKASGKIVIYNNYSSATQRLINNTRFEATNGNIYRIASSVDVPGTKVVSGKTVPGSIEVTVYADQPGESYNLKLADLQGDFKIPGFEGSPRYNSFYARLKTDITGGFIGKQKIVSQSIRETTEGTIRETLKGELLKELYAIKPDNYIIFPDSYSITYTSLPDSSESSSDEVEIGVSGELNSLVFNSLKLGNYFATKKIANFDAMPTAFIFGDELSINFSAKDKANLWNNQTVELKLNGQANIKWIYDPEQIKKDLSGKPRADIISILSKYQNQVVSMTVSFRPVWTRYFPENLEKIKIIELDE